MIQKQNSTYIALFAIVGLILLQSACSYLPTDGANELNYPVEETDNFLLMRAENQAIDQALLFIPGGLVDPHAYLKTFLPFVKENNLSVIIPKVRGNLAITNINQTNKVMDHFDEFSSFILAGHSLGGTVAAYNASCDRSKISALVFMASYSTKDLHDLEIPVIIFRGSEDGLVKPSDITDNEKNVPPSIQVNKLEDLPSKNTAGNTINYTIEGGNHAQFGTYGKQKGDGKATISPEAQQNEFYQALVKILQNNGFTI